MFDFLKTIHDGLEHKQSDLLEILGFLWWFFIYNIFQLFIFTSVWQQSNDL